MDVSIQEKSFSFAVEYVIETPNATLQARKKILSLLAHITVQRSDGSLLATITGESFFRTRFTIDLPGERSYNYHCEKMWKGVDICEGEGGPYRLYAHKGVRYSIFQQDRQIAAFSRDQLSIGNGRNFDLRVNPDVNLALIVSMTLCLNTEDGDDQQNSTMTYDFGRLGPEDRKFDEAWRPVDERPAS